MTRPTHSQWQQLGYISNDKPSAIFKLKGTAMPSTAFATSHDTESVVAQIGISIEPLENIQHLTSQLTKAPSASLVQPIHMASKLAEVRSWPMIH
jgi:hypothetical protein